MDLKSRADFYANQYGIDPETYRRLIQQESGWDPSAKSRTGALGLTQVLPSTASDPGFGVAPMGDMNNTDEQLRFGAEYLSKLLNRYDGDMSKALGAYNWGAGNVDKLGLENAPPETQNYINAVRGGGGHISVSTMGGPGALSGMAPDELILAQNPDGTMDNSALIRMAGQAIMRGEEPSMDSFGSPANGALSTSTANTTPAPTNPDGTTPPADDAKKSLLERMMPNLTPDQRRMNLLAIGSGLLSGDGWATGLAGAAQNLNDVWSKQRDDAAGLARTQAASGGSAGSVFNISGRDPKTGMEVVRQGVMIGGIPHVYGPDGKPVPAASVMTDFRIAGRNESADVTAGAGGIPNATYVSKDGVPSFSFKRGDEAKLYTYARRAIQADKDINQIAATVGPEAMTSLQSGLERWASQNAGASITGAVLNDILNQSGIQGSARSAMALYLQAVLRADTGAAYTGTEIADYAGAFLPNPGDSPEQQSYKANIRRNQILSMIGGTGAAAPYLSGVMDGSFDLGNTDFSFGGSTQQPGALSSPSLSNDTEAILKGYGL